MSTATARRSNTRFRPARDVRPDTSDPGWQIGHVFGRLGVNDAESPLMLFEERFSNGSRVDCKELCKGHLADLAERIGDRVTKLKEKGYVAVGANYWGSNPLRLAEFAFLWGAYKVVFVVRLQDPNDPKKDEVADPFADDQQFEPAPAVPRAKNLPPDATYTVVRDGGDHRTFRIRTAQDGGLKGQRIVEYLCGQDNERDYAGFAFLKPDGAVVLWNRFRTPKGEELRRDFLVVLEPGVAQAAGEAYALQSGRCCRCNRKLTVPASLHRGMGPECAEKGGF